ncbi:MAG TPA: CRISPR-associated protein Csx11 [Ktedonobacteraceae bacterium]
MSDIEAKIDTVWIDEVSDINGRLALIVAQFSIEDWLTGNAFNSVLSIDPSEHDLIVTKRGKHQNLSEVPRYPFKLSTFVNIIGEGLRKDEDLLKSSLSDFILSEKDKSEHKTRGLDTVNDVYKNFVRNTDLEAATSHPNPELLALALLRQWPTPARISRVWHTTQTFWQEIASDFKAETQVGEVSPRLRIRGIFQGRGERLGISHTYELKIGNVNLSITSIANREFLTVDNLQRTSMLLNAPKESRRDYLSAATYIQDLLQNRLIDLEEPGGYRPYGSTNNVLGKLQITDVIIEPTPYVPAISLLTEPRTFMAIVPADKAIEVAKAIMTKYEKEMGKVRNRLPLTLGIVFAGRRTPLPAILDAGRRLLKQSTDDETWIINEVDRSARPQEIKLTMKKDEQTIMITVPTVMGDGETKDVWYPYWQVNNITRSSRTRQFTGADGIQWVHVHDLLKGDSVSFKPSRFDFEFLDTAARRFEVSYDNSKRRGSQRPSRPYYLEQLESFERLWNRLSDKTCGLTASQIHNLIGIIETKRMEWAIDPNDGSSMEPFVHFVGEVLNDAEWKQHPSKDDMKLLHQAAVSGQLADVVELYIRILKKDVGENS